MHASRALDEARQDLRDQFQHFESDSSAWVRFLKNGNEQDYEDSGRPILFIKEALEIMSVVNHAGRIVQKACGKRICEQ